MNEEESKAKEIEMDAKGAAYLQRAMDSVDMVGIEGVAGSQPSARVMAGGLAHLLANVTLAPPYESVVKAALFQSVLQLKMIESLPDSIRERIESGSSMVVGSVETERRLSNKTKIDGQGEIVGNDHDVSSGIWCEKCQGRHEVNTKFAGMLSLARVMVDNHPPMILFQMFDGKDHKAAGMHCAFTASELDHIIESLQHVRPTLDFKAS